MKLIALIPHILKNRKFLVCVAVSMMIISGLLSFFFIEHNQTKIVSLTSTQKEKQDLIRDIWFDLNEIKRQAETDVILNTLMKQTNGKTPDEIREIARGIQDKKLDQINTVYVETRQLSEQSQTLEAQNRLLSNIMFFFQLLGLILVIITRELPE